MRWSEVLRQAELAAGEDVLLHLGGAAADRVEHGVAVRRLRPALHRGVLGADPQLRARAAEIHRRVGEALGELGREQLVGARLRGRGRTALERLRDEPQAEAARHLRVGREPRDAGPYDGVVAQWLTVTLRR